MSFNKKIASVTMIPRRREINRYFLHARFCIQIRLGVTIRAICKWIQIRPLQLEPEVRHVAADICDEIGRSLQNWTSREAKESHHLLQLTRVWRKIDRQFRAPDCQPYLHAKLSSFFFIQIGMIKNQRNKSCEPEFS